MARPREFDRDEALAKAMQVFWAKGFAATSTDDLLTAMNIARQSLYNAFGDKRQLYLESLRAYQRKTNEGHVARLNAPKNALAGVQALLTGLVAEDDAERALGCMGVGSVCEFGTTDDELVALRTSAGKSLHKSLLQRIREGQEAGTIDRAMSADKAASFVQMTMTGLQVAARGGASTDDLKQMARFAVERLRSN